MAEKEHDDINIDRTSTNGHATSPLAHQPNGQSSPSTNNTIHPKQNTPDVHKEDTFYQSLQIRLHHSVGSLSISPTCRDVVLAGRQGLVIIDLENPWLIPRILPHMSKWEVSDIQWSPYVSREAWVASTSNQKLLIWNLHSSAQAVEHTLNAHARAISDINWSPHHPDIVATCSVDTYVRVWDLRCAGESSDQDHYYRPANSFTPWNAAATQVKFNFKNEHLVASSHDKDVKIWDMRKGAVPMTSITAHSKKIYGIDWSRQNDHDIYWNIHSPEEAEETIVTNSPVWRARNTPFGHGVLTMPQRTETTLNLYNRATPDKPVHMFEGHTNTVKEFVWRRKGGLGSDGDDREFQLVTWSKDQNLRLWPVSEDVMKEVPAELDNHDARSKSIADAIAPVQTFAMNTHPHSSLPPGNVHYSRSYNLPAGNYREQKYTINPLLWMQNVKTVSSTSADFTGASNQLTSATPRSSYQSLADELSTVLNKYASMGVKTEKVNAAARTCTVSLHGPWTETGNAFLRITIVFSQQYPDNSPPAFEIQKNSLISIYYRTHMAQDLNALATSYTSQKQWCLEPCLRYLLGETMQDESRLGRDKRLQQQLLQHPHDKHAATTATYQAWSNEADSDDDIFVPSLLPSYGIHGKRDSTQSETGIVDLSSHQTADAKVPFPRLCGATFSGSGQLVCFFSNLRVRDPQSKKDRPAKDTTPSSNSSNAEYFEHTYHDFYKHPRSYEQFEEYKEIAAMSKQGRHAGVMVGTHGAFGEYDDDPDDIEDGLAMGSIYFKTEMLDATLKNKDDLLYHGSEAEYAHNVTITDFSYILPFQLELTKDLQLFPTNPGKTCEHNALVLKQNDRLDVSRMWHIAMEVLRESVPLDLPARMDLVFDFVYHQHPDLQILPTDPLWLRDAKLADINELLGRGYTIQPNNALLGLKRRVRWGAHPFGRGLITSPMVESPGEVDQHDSPARRGPMEIHKISTPVQPWAIATYAGMTMPTNTMPGLRSSVPLSTSYQSRSSVHWTPPFNSSQQNKTPSLNNWAVNVTTTTPVTPPVAAACTPLTATAAPTASPVPPPPGSIPLSSANVLPHQAVTVTSKEGDVLANDSMTIEFTNIEWFDSEKMFIYNPMPLISPDMTGACDLLRWQYADVLYRQDLLNERAEVLQDIQTPFLSPKQWPTTQPQVYCYMCNAAVATPDRVCHHCRKIRTQIQCIVCHQLVKGLVHFCLKCQHGGHAFHMKDWFDNEQVCPTGCGCHCLKETNGLQQQMMAQLDIG
ncbi:hypothetical protein DM01DRAFT_267212 [Hesseltinella vesiculosa]|uniref:WDR59/RTC1-like RING zinc finger domain-containing protein n=1 Tax=Hesseltinella vesiculosa TaxID=101127 RepID=A0A1X2GXR7_9FUNG|nr:hypothetical protein DM01DRAFT_267212 [Hesseltinella vesiculosa]